MTVAALLGQPRLPLFSGAAPVFGCHETKVAIQLKKGTHSLFSAIYVRKAELCWLISNNCPIMLVWSLFCPPVILWNSNIFLQCITVIWIFLCLCCKNMLVDVLTCQNIQWDELRQQDWSLPWCCTFQHSLVHIICRSIFNGHIILSRQKGFLFKLKLLCLETDGEKKWPSYSRVNSHSYTLSVEKDPLCYPGNKWCQKAAEGGKAPRFAMKHLHVSNSKCLLSVMFKSAPVPLQLWSMAGVYLCKVQLKKGKTWGWWVGNKQIRWWSGWVKM